MPKKIKFDNFLFSLDYNLKSKSGLFFRIFNFFSAKNLK